MISFDSALQTILNTATTKSDWSSKLFIGLGDARTIVCKKHAESISVFNEGTAFIDADISGAMISVAGNITSFGVISNARIHTAADLSSGYSVIRIIGNGHYIEGTLGLVGSECDFIVRASPTISSGFGFDSACAVLAPRFLPSGAGPAAPVFDLNSPYTVSIENWATGAAVVAGTANFDTRIDDLVFEDVDLSAEIGDVAIYQSSQSIIHGNFEFGIMLLRSASSNTDTSQSPAVSSNDAAQPIAALETLDE